MWENIDTDTITTDNAYFVANEWGAKYKWRLGGEIINTKSFSRESFPDGALLNVSLETTKKHPLWGQCFPTTDTVFTKNRSFRIQIGWAGCKVLGDYSGVFSSKPNETKTINLKYYESLNLSGIKVKGFETCINDTNTDILITNPQATRKQIYFHYYGNNICAINIIGIMKVYGQTSDSLTMNYRVYDFSNLSPNFLIFT